MGVETPETPPRTPTQKTVKMIHILTETADKSENFPRATKRKSILESVNSERKKKTRYLARFTLQLSCNPRVSPSEIDRFQLNFVDNDVSTRRRRLGTPTCIPFDPSRLFFVYFSDMTS